MEKFTWVRQLWISTIIISLGVPSLLGQKYHEEKHSGNSEANAYDDKPLKYDGNYAQYLSDQEAAHRQSQHFEESSSSVHEQIAKTERIIKPSVGDFKPSPPVKFPETLTPPTSISAYGEIDTSAGDYGEAVPRKVHPSPYSYYGKYQGPPSQQIHYHHPHPPAYSQNHEEKQEQYREYDTAIPEERPYHHYVPPPQNYYQPAPPAIPPGTGIFVKDQFKGPWKTIVKALTALVPIGLFLAALPPNFISINSTVARTGKEGRSSAVEDGLLEEEELLKEEYPVLDLMGRFGLSALDDPECDSRIFCEMSRLGERDEGNVVQKFFWTIVNEAPDMLAEVIGLKKLFKAVRTDSCDTYKCEEKSGNSR